MRQAEQGESSNLLNPRGEKREKGKEKITENYYISFLNFILHSKYILSHTLNSALSSPVLFSQYPIHSFQCTRSTMGSQESLEH